MYRWFSVCVVALVCSFASAQNLSDGSNPASPSSTPVQVVYVINNSTLTTYNVNAHTLQATQVGASTLPQSLYGGIATSPNRKFLYYTQFSGNPQQEELYVYQTNATRLALLTSAR